jgi:hypothetical protein
MGRVEEIWVDSIPRRVRETLRLASIAETLNDRRRHVSFGDLGDASP